MAGAPTPTRQLRMLQTLRSRGLVLAKPDHQVLRYLEYRRQVRAIVLHDTRGGKPIASLRAWEITPTGVAAALLLTAPSRRTRAARAAQVQIDLEEAIASSGERPVSLPLPDLDAPAVTAVGVSAPEGRSSKHALAAAKPEPTHA